MPFKRVAVDIVGPIAPPSDAGHMCFLTLVDYATKELMSECMQEVPRLLSIKGLTSMPYHLICNGLEMEQSPEVYAQEALPRPAEAVAQSDQPCSICLQRSSSKVDSIQSISAISCHTDAQSDDLERS